MDASDTLTANYYQSHPNDPIQKLDDSGKID